MKGQKPIKTVRDLMMYLSACPPDAEIQIMPEDGDGFQIGGVLEFSAQKPAEVWILIDEFAESKGLPDEWTGGAPDDDDEGSERPGDMAAALQTEATDDEKTVAAYETELEDVVVVRGKMRSA